MLRTVPYLVIGSMALANCGRFGFDERQISTDAGDTDASSVDAPPDAPFDATGYWVIESALVPGEANPRLRTDLVDGLRGDVELSEANESYSGRAVFLRDSVPQATPLGSSGQFTRETSPDRWVFVTSEAVMVYEPVIISADVVDLEIDTADPRNTGGSLPTSMRIARGEAPPPVFSDAMELVEVLFPGEPEAPAGVCVALDTEAVIYAGELIQDPAGLSRSVITIRRFGDPDCVDIVSQFVEDRQGLGELDGEIVRSWSVAISDGPDAAPIFVEYTMTTAGETIQLDRTDCEPQPACDGDLFSRLIFAPTTVSP